MPPTTILGASSAAAAVVRPKSLNSFTRIASLTSRTSTSTSTTARLSRPFPAVTSVNSTRPLSTTSRALYAANQSQDKDSLNPISSEYSKSGGDDAAAQDSQAFDPSTTTPEETKGKSGGGPGGDPLEVSPGNPEVSKPRDPQEGGPESSPSQERGDKVASGRGKPTKGSGKGS